MCRGDWDCGRGIIRLSFAGGECRGGCTKGTCMQSWAVAIVATPDLTPRAQENICRVYIAVCIVMIVG